MLHSMSEACCLSDITKDSERLFSSFVIINFILIKIAGQHATGQYKKLVCRGGRKLGRKGNITAECMVMGTCRVRALHTTRKPRADTERMIEREKDR